MKGIREFAKHLNVSIGTVSRALNNRPDVNEETRKRVLEAAVKFGYVANQSGRSLRQGTTKTVGFMLESNSAGSLAGDNFFMGVVDGLQSVFHQHRLDLVLLPCGVDDDPNAFLQRLVARRFVDGMIISETRRHDLRIETLLRADLPFVALGQSQQAGTYAWLDVDFEGTAHDATTRLASLGHRRIAIAVPSSDVNYGDLFLSGYCRALSEAKIDLDRNLVIPTKFGEGGGAEFGSAILAMKERPTAVILVHSAMAIGLYHVLDRAGLRAGRDIAVVGSRENPQTRFLRPSLACYFLPLRDMGAALAETLIEEMARRTGPQERPIATSIWPMTFVTGESICAADP